jgi:transcriptional regulator with XRE-family HTH domain
MAVGDRIKRVRNMRGMTQKELGLAAGFDDNSADVRIAQYESGARTPKEDMLKKIADVLDVNFRSLYEPTLYAAEDIIDFFGN